MRGPVSVMGLAERAGLSELIPDRVWIKQMRVKSAAVNPGKLTSIIGGWPRARTVSMIWT